MSQNDQTNGPSAGGKTHRGFAAMDQSRQREIARKGGESVPDEKRSFSQNRELAAAAGRKGGEARGRNRHKSSNA
jgi:general stress protein YciG